MITNPQEDDWNEDEEDEVEVELPCLREKEGDSWTCSNDHTGCMWNDGHNVCGYESSHPHDTSPLNE